jgi:FkbH-like protein
MANWNSKADNINQIQKILNIGFDSMVFIDDNPAEREIVRTHIPKILVPELPLDPADYLPFLISQNIFETVSYSNNDSERTRQYQEESKRVALSQSITNMDDYLLSLNMRAIISNFQSVDIERIAQLSQRSNQFNLRTKRYSIQDIENIMSKENYLTFSVHLHDKFGSYGLISMVIVKIEENRAFIDTWIMSCRVLKRTVEHLLMNLIVSKLIERKIDIIKGEYLPTDKNKLVEHLLSELAMDKLDENNYQLKISKYIPFKHFINY